MNERLRTSASPYLRAHAGNPVAWYAWGGAASTAFWIDPAEELAVVFMTQLLPSNTYPLRRHLQAGVYQALVG